MIDQRDPRQDSPRDITVGPLIRLGVRRAWVLRDQFLRLAIVPLAVRLAVAPPLLGVILPMQPGVDEPDASMLLQGVLMGLLYSAAGAAFAVNWIRQLTLGYAGAPGVGLGIAPRHLRFFLWIAAITFLVFFPAFMIGMPLFSVALGSANLGLAATFVMSSLVWLALLARLSPAWIGVALDAPMRFSVAWNRTRGQGFKLMLAVLAAEIAVMIVAEIVGELLNVVGLAGAAPYSYLLIRLAIDLAGTAVQLAILVTAFPHFLRETV